MPRKKLKRPQKPVPNAVDPAEESARRLKREENSRRRESTLEKMKSILNRRRDDRLAKKNAIRDERISLYQTEIRRDMKSVLQAGVDSVNALRVIADKVKLDGSTMKIGGVKYRLKNNVHMVGWGRESLMLGPAFEKVIGKQMKKGFLVVPRGSISGMWDTPLWFPALNTRITYLEAGGPGSPDESSVAATRRIADYCRKLRKRDILVVVLSGGTEDLLSCPKGAIRLKEFREVLSALKSAGATPSEITIVESKLSAVLGGGLARLAYPAKVITLAMSEIPGDPPHLVAGAPTVNNPNKDAASAILKRYDIERRVPSSVKDVLDQEEPAPDKDPLLDDERNFKFVDYHVVAGSNDAVQGMTDAAFRLGLVPVILSSTIVGEVREVSRAYSRIAALMILAAEGKVNRIEMHEAMKFDRVLPLSEDKVREIFPSNDNWGLGLCLLAGGAPTLDVNEGSRTGANQELALYFSLDWYLKVKENPILRNYVVWFLGGSTSGVDGNTGAAGAYGYGNLGPGIFKRHKDITAEEAELDLKLRGLVRTDPDGKETREAVERRNALRDEIARVSAVLPDRVLRDHNANFMFTNINDGDELLNLGYTYTSVCDLHVIRIARYQCNCDGHCLGQLGDEKAPLQDLCRDENCVVNRTMPAAVVSRSKTLQCCGRTAQPKIKIHSKSE